MSVSMKDFTAEAADIARHLTPYVNGPILSSYVGARCTTLVAANDRFDRDKFIRACVGTTPEPSGRITVEESQIAGYFTITIPELSTEGTLHLDGLDTLIYEATSARERFLRSRWDNEPAAAAALNSH